jgi:hypothetical protein
LSGSPVPLGATRGVTAAALKRDRAINFPTSPDPTQLPQMQSLNGNLNGNLIPKPTRQPSPIPADFGSINPSINPPINPLKIGAIAHLAEPEKTTGMNPLAKTGTMTNRNADESTSIAIPPENGNLNQNDRHDTNLNVTQNDMTNDIPNDRQTVAHRTIAHHVPLNENLVMPRVRTI